MASKSSSDNTLSKIYEKSEFDLLKDTTPCFNLNSPKDQSASDDDTWSTKNDTLQASFLENNTKTATSASSSLMTSPSTITTTSISNSSSPRPATFCIGDLVWGAVRGCNAWPGKIVNGPDGEPTSSDCVWVKWFGGRQNTEMILTNTLKSLSEGLEAHHAAQKDIRK